MNSKVAEVHALGDALMVLESGQRPSGGASVDSGEIPSLGGENIDLNGQLRLDTIKRVPRLFFAAMRSGHLKDGDVLINKDGAQTGKVAIYEGQFPDAAINEHVYRLRADPHVLDQRFVYHHLRSARSQAVLKSFITGSAQPGLNRRFVKGVFLSAVPVAEQQRIAHILDTVDAAIHSTERLISKLEQVKQGLLHDLLTRGIDDNGRLRDPVRYPEQFENGAAGGTPRLWSRRRLGECAETFAGGTPSRGVPGLYGGSIPWVKSGELNQPLVTKTEECITQRAVAVSAVRMVPAGVPIVAMYGATAGVVSWLAIPAATNQAVLAIVPVSSSVRPRWLYWELSLATARLLRAIQGSGQPNLSKGTIDDTIITIPSPEEQEHIAQVADGFAGRLDQERLVLAKLHQLKQGLTEDLLAGRVRVSVDDREDAA